MADTYTTNLNLTKPEPGAAEDTWGISLNADLDSLDAIFSSTGTQVNLNANQINFADNKKAIFGTGNDLQIYHDGSNSIIQDSGAGNLQLRGASFVIMQSDDGENMVRGQKNAGVRLYYDGATKLDTTSTGIDITGTAELDVLSIGGTAITATATELNYVDGVTGSIQTQLGTKIENSDDVTLGTISSGAITSTGNSQMANLVVTGDLTVQGTTTTVNTDDLNVKDKNITLNYSTGDSSASANGAGITIQDAVSATQDATLTWNTANDSFNFSHPLNVTGNIASSGTVAGQGVSVNSSGYGSIEVGGVSGAFIDLKRPNSDDFDLRLITTGTGGEIDTGSGELTLKRQGSTVLTTQSTGINVTGTVTADGLTVDGNTNLTGDFSITDNIPKITLEDSDTNTLASISANSSHLTYTTTATTRDHTFKQGTTTRMVIDDTGIDVTGTATVDGLNLGDNQYTYFGTNAAYRGELSYDSSGNTSFTLANSWNNDNSEINFKVKTAGTGKKALQIKGSGDISFYDSAGTTQGLFWDASAERLGLGTTTPDAPLDVVAPTTNSIYASFSSTDTRPLQLSSFNTVSIDAGHNFNATSGNGAISFSTGGTERLRVNSTGIDVTGTTVTDSLTVSDGTNGIMQLGASNTRRIAGGADYGGIRYYSDNDHILYTNNVQRLAINSGGDISFYDDTGTSQNLKWDASADTLNFVDNAKATFGASNDLQIYHDGNNSRVEDTGTGGLRLIGGNFVSLQSTSGENMVVATENGAVTLYHNNAQKLATTSTGIDVTGSVSASGTVYSQYFGSVSDTNTLIQFAGSDDIRFRAGGTERLRVKTTGIDVTGTVTSDGLTVDNGSTFALSATLGHTGGSQLFFLSDDGGARNQIDSQTSGSAAKLDLATGGIKRQRIDSNGDISFYDDTGSTQGLFWDASAEALGIGTTSPSAPLTVSKAGAQITGQFINPTASQTARIYVTCGTQTGHIQQHGNTHATDPNTLRLNTTAGDITIAPSSVERVRVTTSGNVGIGITSPSATLDVEGRFTVASNDGHSDTKIISTSNRDPRLYFLEGTTQRGYIQSTAGTSQLLFGTGSTERMRIDSAGRLGIGTSSPSEQLDVSGNVLFGSGVGSGDAVINVGRGRTADGNAYIDLHSDTATYTDYGLRLIKESGANGASSILHRGTGTFTIETDEAAAIRFNTNSVERLRINSSGNVGIGTDSPATSLSFGEASTGITFLSTATNFNSGKVAGIRGEVGGTGYGNLAFDTFQGGNGGGERMMIRYDGNVGIGTSSPSSNLEVYNSINTQLRVNTASNGYLDLSNYTNGAAVMTSAAHPLRFGTSNTERLRIDSSGNLLVGTTSAGNSSAGFRAYAGGNGAFTIAGTTLSLNRLSSDGEILNFQKDTSTVGSIGTNGGALYISSPYGNDSGLRFVSGIIAPATTTGANRDAAIDLGYSSGRFKDLHLSGTANVGAINITGSGTSTFGGAITVQGNIITDSGRVGIGTSSPAYSLDTSTEDNIVARFKSTDASAAILLTDNTSTSKIDNNNGVLSFSADEGDVASGTAITFKTDTAERVRITSAGRMGIGTSFPSQKLEVYGLDPVVKVAQNTGAAGHATLTLAGAGSGSRAYNIISGDAGYSSGSGLHFEQADGLQVTMQNGGNVGIGTSSPSSNLHIKTSVDNSLAQGLVIERSANTDKGYINYNGGGFQFRSTVGDPIVFGETDAEHLRINPDGNIGIGTSSPSAKLEVNGYGKFTSSDNSPRLYLTGGRDYFLTATSSGLFGLYDNTASSYRLAVDTSGNVGIGTSSPNAKLESYVSGNFSTTYNNFSGDGLYIQTNGTVADGEYTAGISFSRTAGNNARVAGIAGVQEGTDADKSGLAFFTHPSTGTTDALQESLRISADGNVGIGNSSPQQKLTVGDGADTEIISIFAGSGAASGIHFTDTNTSGDDFQGFVTYDHTADALRFGTAEAERMRIDSSGNFGIGMTPTTNNISKSISLVNGGSIFGYGNGTYITGNSNYNGAWNTVATGVDSRMVLDGNVIFSRSTSASAGSAGAATESMRIDLSGKVGIGTTSPSANLEITQSGNNVGLLVAGGGYNHTAKFESVDAEANIIIEDSNSTNDGNMIGVATNDMYFITDTAERMRIDSSGRLIVGGTSAGQTGATTIYPNGNIASASITATGNGVFNFFKTETFNPVLTANDSESDTGQIIAVQIGGTTKGNIGINSATGNDMYIASGTTSSAGVGLRFIDYQVTNIQPCRGNGSTLDNVIDLGSVGARFDDIYATNGTIQTSDENEKQDIQALTDAEQRVATACKGLIRRFRWQDSVAEKDDNPDSDETARYHFGVIAQDLQDAFTAEGLDASDYGMFISSTWTDDDGVEQTRLGVRYNELLAFIITTL